MSALVYTLRAVLGAGNLTTQPPNTELTALDCSSTGGGECGTPGDSGSDEPCDTSVAMSTLGGGGGGSSKGGSKGKGGVTL